MAVDLQQAALQVSTHTPHARCDRTCSYFTSGQFKFLLTHLMRGVTNNNEIYANAERFLLTHLMRGVTINKENKIDKILVSTHTPHARCDNDPSRI